MDSDKINISEEHRKNKQTSGLDELLGKESESDTLNLSLISADEKYTEEESQSGPSSGVEMEKAKIIPSPIAADVEIFDAAGIRKRSTVDVATSSVPSSSSQSTINGNDDLKEPTPEVVPLSRTVASTQLSQRPVETESNALLLSGICILITKLVTQGFAGIISSVGLVLCFRYPVFAEQLLELLSLFLVAVLSLIFQFGLWSGNSMDEIRTQFLQCLILPNLPLSLVALFIVLRVVVYFILSYLLGSIWFTTFACILGVIVSIPALCIIFCEIFISGTMRMVHELDNDSDVQQNKNQ